MPPASDPPEGPPRLTCRCIGVPSFRIAQAIREHGLVDIDGVRRATRAGSGCGTCHPELDEILLALRGEPIPEEQRLANLRTNRWDCERRIEEVLEMTVVPRLRAGVAVELVSVQGLSVELHLSGEEPGLRSWIADALRKRVCDVLEVRFG